MKLADRHDYDAEISLLETMLAWAVFIAVVLAVCVIVDVGLPR